MAQIIHEKRFDAVDHRAHARSMNLQSQLVPAGYGDIGAINRGQTGHWVLSIPWPA